MNNEERITKMVSSVEKIERTFMNDKFASEISGKKSIVNAILEELEKVIDGENQ